MMLPVWGKDYAPSNRRGVVSPTGKLIPYGKPYHRRYFLGKIK